MGLAWSVSLSVGNAMLDSDHKNLIAVVNRVEDAVATGDRAAVSTAFALLEAYMRIHTQNEEKIAAAVNYPFADDRMAQRQLMDEMKYMMNKLQSVSGAWPDNLLQMYSRYLTGWITDHIVKTNRQLKAALKAYPYDFIPGKTPVSSTLQPAMILSSVSHIDPRAPAC